ncbi:hypothetical protein B0H17DRAFT_1209079 [Mycena rosella]|uniref:F-box domain-containing protein n=1 Tax=Mycena rosella TaxID=1033263 RepID=A0AAD7CZK3_MYCRO|nr:hypothetical protein B0H17DRAFT_1209079 [Mycena rosella]
MHRGLRIPEVVELICGEAKFSTLVALAQTCQALQPPALSVLWRDQSDLMPLLKCLPSDLWELEEVENRPTRLRFRRAIAPSDWTRVIFYAVYVKSFVESGLWPEIYAALSLSLPKSPLFPNIRHLTWRTGDDVFPYIRLLVGDKLRSIVVSMHGSEAIRASLLPSLTTFHPKLTHVEFDTLIADRPMIYDAIYSAICSWNHLEKLKFGALNLPAMLHLARLPNLKYLQLSRFPSDSATIREFQAKVASTGAIFAALRELYAAPEFVRDIISFLDVIDSDALNKVHLSIEVPTVTEDWQTLNTVLARKSSRTLTRLSLNEEFSHSHDFIDALERMLTTESIQPLLSCPNLVELSVGTAYGIDLDDAFLKQLALALPRLQKLDLSPGCQSARYVPQVTLGGLVPLAQHCPNLAVLAIVMNATDVDPYAKEKPGGGISNTSLTDLDVVESPISFPAAVASFLSAIFPNLRLITMREEMIRNPLAPDWDENMDNWAAVGNLVQVISSARAQEHCVTNIG